MIPRLPVLPDESIAELFCEALRRAGFAGTLDVTAAQRAVFATDNSIYHVAPAAVVFPASAHDVALLVRLAGEPRFASLVFAPRGGGTGTNGQSLTPGIVVDMSRHMNRILDIDPSGRRVRVEAGVVKDQLNAALAPHGLFFAPELSTSNRATIGGMISTDACGQGSCLYGKTHDHVRGLTTVMMDGTVLRSGPLDDARLADWREHPGLAGTVHRVVDDLQRRDGALFREVLPELNRSVTGYDLANVRDAKGRFNLNAVICGSEGTLGFIVEAELAVLPVPACVALVTVRYASFDAALRDARNLMATEPASVETIDAAVLALARGDALWTDVAPFFPDDGGVAAQGVNIVEYVADDDTTLASHLAQAEAALVARRGAGTLVGHAVVREPGGVAAIWAMRKKAVGLLGNMSGPARPLPFVEDAAVPPERLADFVAAFRAVLDRHGLRYGMFGHVDAGVLHVRPALDLTDPAQRHLVRVVSDEVAALTRAHGGVLWGEHGKGVRSEYAPEVFGPLYPAMQSIKAAFDPANRLNPGKVAAPAGSTLLRIDEVPMRAAREAAVPAADRTGTGNAFHCNGNGLCFDFEADAVMCPSYKGTRDRRHSPKGRASLIREWTLRLRAAGVEAADGGPRLRDWPWRAAATWARMRGEADFSHEVEAALDGCLSCKGCSGLCPIKVDVPSFRARFLEAYHGRYLRSPAQLAIGWVEHLLPAMAAVRPLYQAATGTDVGRGLCRRLGLAALPAMPERRLRSRLTALGAATATQARLWALSEADRRRSVVLVVDSFTRFFDPEVAADAVDLLVRLGLRVWLAPLRPNGKALHVQGMLGAFNRTARRHATELKGLADTGVQLVGLDPALTLTYRSDYAKELGAAATPPVQLMQEWLAGACEAGTVLPPRTSRHSYTLLPHCTEQALAGESVARWRDVFARFGLELEIKRLGCCGMAGTFGHETRHRALSETIYGQSWHRHVGGEVSDQLLATGYSCRSQVALVDGLRLPHPLQVLLLHAKAAGLALPHA